MLLADLSLVRQARGWSLAAQFRAEGLNQRAPIGILKRRFALSLGTHPNRRRPHRVRLETWEDVPVDVRFEIAETFVIQLERPRRQCDRAAHSDRLVKECASVVGWHQMDFSRV